VRPLRIEFQAFGPYPERVEVDLTTLMPRGLFVVAGDTGTGKTTILDAMSYALYGSMPLKDSGEIRSHHAALGDRTEVRLTFEVSGETWIIERSPAQERRGKNASAEFVTERTTASLSRVRNSSTEPVASNITSVDAKIKELVGLTADQFQRVVLLPQAKVTEFLLANSREREMLLEQLFDGRLFDVILGELKQRVDASTAAVGAANDELRTHLVSAARELDEAESALREPAEPVAAEEASDPPLRVAAAPSGSAGGADPDPGGEEPSPVDPATGDLDPSELRSRLAATAPAVADLEREDAAASTAATDAASALTSARAAADRFDRATILRSELEDLRSQLPDAEEGAERARRSQQARPVVDSATRAQLAASALAAAEDGVRLAREPIDRVLLDLGESADDDSLPSIRELVDTLRSRHRSRRAALEALDSATAALESSTQAKRDLARELAGHQQQADEALGRLNAIDELLPPLAEVAGRLTDLEQQVSDSTKAIAARCALDEARVSQATATNDAVRLDAAYAALFSRFVATSAPRLASGLIADEPCPVCGSPEHPAPATTSGDEPVDQADLDAAASAKDLAARARADAEAKVERITSELGEAAARSEDDLATELAEARAAVETADRARGEHAALTEERRTVEEAQRVALTKVADVSGRIAEVDRQLTERASDLETARTEADGVDRSEVEALAGHLAGLDTLLPPLEAASTELRVATGAHREAAAHAAEALEGSEFTSAADAQALVVELDVESQLLQAHVAVTSGITKRTGGLQTLEEQGVPEDRPDVEAAESISTQRAATAEQLRSRLHRVQSALERAEQALSRHADLDAGSVDAREALDLLSRTYDVCKDGGGPKIPLKRWILARELERVTRAANEHLRSMTNGRYTLRVKPEASDGRRTQGLGLEVFDAETGQARSTSSLSGGEQFQASLALALGLADVVSQGGVGSGHRFEALFVDEGFGALDPDALDDAIETLQSLHATGRTIGVITHVEAMKERLHVGIQVERRPDGRGSRLTVLP
jgi:exonuclease SbcC